MVADAQDIPEGYKRTEVGVIPEEWTTPQIQTISKLINGRGFKPYEWRTSGLPIIRIQNLNGSQQYNYFDGHYDKKIEVEDGQLLFAWSGSRGTSFGPHYWDGPLGLLNYHTWKVVSFDAKVDPSYYFHALKGLTKDIEDSAHGASALVHVQKWEIEARELALPTPKEQTAIAEALTDADEAIRSLEAVIAKKRDVKQATLHALLTPTRRLPGFSGAWEVRPLGDLLKVMHGKSQHHVIDTDGMYPILATGGQIGKTNHFLHNRPSVLIGRKGTIDKPQYMDQPFWSVDTLFFTIITDPNVPKFLYYSALLIPWKSYNEASGVPSLNAKTIEGIEIKVPKPEEQSAIANILSDMDEEIDALDTRLDKLRDIKQGMMQVLLTGKVRLI